MKALALTEELTRDMKELVRESLRQLRGGRATEGLIARVLCDTIDPLNYRILTAVLISDLDLYTDLITLLDALQHPSPSTLETPKEAPASLTPTAASVLDTDDSSLYDNESLRNINRFYFKPLLDESIPYHSRPEPLDLRVWDALRATPPVDTDLVSKQRAYNSKIQPETLNRLKELVDPVAGYVGGFCNALFNGQSLDEVEAARMGGQQAEKLMEMDYTLDSDRSFVTGPGLLLRDSKSLKAVHAFNKVLLHSGVVREFIDRQRRQPREDRREYLRQLVERKGALKKPLRDVVLFPHVFDYMVDNELIYINPRGPNRETQLQRHASRSLQGAAPVKVTELNYSCVKVDQLN